MEAPSLASSWRLNQAGRKLKDKNGTSGCNIPSEIQDDDFLPDITIPGAVVWAKQDNLPWWPGIVGGSPDHEEYRKVEKNGQEFYHVNFFGDKVWQAWVKEDKITPFVPNPMSKQKKPAFTVTKKNQPHFRRATKQAKRAFDMDIQKRINYFRLAVFYERKWPKADNFVTSEANSEKLTGQESIKVDPDSNTQNDLPIFDSNSNHKMESEDEESIRVQENSNIQNEVLLHEPKDQPSDLCEDSEARPECESSPETKKRKFILDEETLDCDNPNFRNYTYLK